MSFCDTAPKQRTISDNHWAESASQSSPSKVSHSSLLQILIPPYLAVGNSLVYSKIFHFHWLPPTIRTPESYIPITHRINTSSVHEEPISQHGRCLGLHSLSLSPKNTVRAVFQRALAAHFLYYRSEISPLGPDNFVDTLSLADARENSRRFLHEGADESAGTSLYMKIGYVAALFSQRIVVVSTHFRNSLARARSSNTYVDEDVVAVVVVSSPQLLSRPRERRRSFPGDDARALAHSHHTLTVHGCKNYARYQMPWARMRLVAVIMTSLSSAQNTTACTYYQ